MAEQSGVPTYKFLAMPHPIAKLTETQLEQRGRVRARGWTGVALNFRSCGGELNRLPRFYHSGDTADLHEVVSLLVERRPAARLGVVGVSIGGNVLLKWLGEQGADAPKAVGA